MRKASLPSVGFDRYVELVWADYALELAESGGETESLKSWLNTQIEGKESARKTYNVLCNLWLNSFPETESIREKALNIAQKIQLNDRIVLHWGMALANFELFQHTTSSMGKLLRLQGGFNRKEIKQRMDEVYSNQGTIPRAVSRIIQSICEWNVIKETDKFSYINESKKILRENDLFSWLLQAALNRHKSRSISLLEVFRLPELFPFEFAENGQKLIRESPAFMIIREGMDQEYVVLKGFDFIN